MNWKRLDPWTYPPDLVGCQVKSDHGQGRVIKADNFGITLDNNMSFMTTPWHSTTKWYIDVDWLPPGFDGIYIMYRDLPHPGLHSQDEWSPNPRINDKLTEDYEI